MRVSVLNAARGGALTDLQDTVATRFRHLDDEQQSARSALGRLEAGALKRFAELEELARGR